MAPRTHRIVRLLAVSLLLFTIAPAKAETDDESIQRLSRALLVGTNDEYQEALDTFTRRGKPDVAAAAILALRFRGNREPELIELLRTLTGGDAGDWFHWMLWQEAHPEVRPHQSFTALQREALIWIDPDFAQLLADPWLESDRLKIRIEEIAWGGVGALDGIPSLDNPNMIQGNDADYLLGDDLVFGIEIAGDARAYPLRILAWHEMMNDKVGGVPVALAFCTLCGAGILFDTRIEGSAEPLVFGSSGLLYRSNKLMFDWKTKSLWNQFTGEPVVGPLTEKKIRLKRLPLVIETWAEWHGRHPKTTVLSLETGHYRDYGSGVAYSDYYASDDLMFPALVDESQGIKAKDYVFGLIGVGAIKAWPIAAFGEGAVINDTLGGQNVVLIGQSGGRDVRAYERGEENFAGGGDELTLVDESGGSWRIEEDFLLGPAGEKRARLPGHIAFWFAWNNYYGQESELYRP